ncbi:MULTISPECIES: DUF6708 domain-containing protein [unclassified Pseudomonas]|uniref:DUF6708 domain-containing protein n=1 Tax=unclassified Pseudomonas TaxID=196821 RepID=UPI0021C96DEC|nr:MULTISPECIES: DUF6708 domain-containing protein [unclassified Pseudomonas]MCU1733197.1 hypothetical protein [Pseudomonas sp. 20P_3.2_Bac4]MCU1745315.1 hypothetical protein [Pseudomonas sp. 20P_3.2_Bac5]
MNRPQLVSPCSGWQEDLPHPDDVPVVMPALGFDTPNHQDDVFLELPRASALIRGLMIWFALAMSILMVVLSWLFFSIEQKLRFEIWTIFLCCLSVGVWSAPIFWKFDVSPPRDMPLRFNRTRQRLYAYNFNYRWWNPFERWRVEPVAYDWSQVRAERWLKRGATSHGVVIKGGVVLSIVKPGTNEVIDRFPLTTMGADEHAWAYICTYMQQGPDALPPPDPPKDHNDVSWCNIAMLLAPKVKWPADMDLESRTAP